MKVTISITRTRDIVKTSFIRRFRPIHL